MQSKTWTFIDKSGWGDGPWQAEPDKMQWTDEATDLPCLAVRTGHSGHWCGYVGVSGGHPAYLVGYESLDISVHGGLTFADSCSDDEHGICHVVEPGEPDDVWWLGFDCAHSGDYTPAKARYGDLYRCHEWETYRTLEYVQEQCRQLAAQLASNPAASDLMSSG